MRTTLTLEPDVAAQLDQLRRQNNRSLKSLVNEVLRAGLEALEQQGRRASERQATYRIKPVATGCRLNNLDNIGEVLTIIEGEDHT